MYILHNTSCVCVYVCVCICTHTYDSTHVCYGLLKRGRKANHSPLGRGGQCVQLWWTHLQLPASGLSTGGCRHRRWPLPVPSPSPTCIDTCGLPSVPQKHGPAPGNPAPVICGGADQDPGFPSPWGFFGQARTKKPGGHLHPDCLL